MISLSMARALKNNGLAWSPQTNDYFAIPDRGMDEKVFVLSEVLSLIDLFHGRSVVTFHGTAEWALDYLVTSEVVWMPRADQLRAEIFDRIATRTSEGPNDQAGTPPRKAAPELVLTSDRETHRCEIHARLLRATFEASSAEDAYAKALLYLLQTGPNPAA